MNPLVIAGAGVGVGTVFGLFGAGGSAFATPVLAMLGVPGVLAVASPLPAMLPASIAGARAHLATGDLNRRLAGLAIAGGLPGSLVGAAVSSHVSGRVLMALSASVLLTIGLRMLVPDHDSRAQRAATLLASTPLVLALTFGVGLATGLLANGGGFLLVPLFMIGLGLSSQQASGTSMVAAGVLTVPTLVAHAALGHINWTVALWFGLGVLPGSLLGTRVAHRLPSTTLRTAFGVTLVAFALWFLATHTLGGVS